MSGEFQKLNLRTEYNTAASVRDRQGNATRIQTKWQQYTLVRSLLKDSSFLVFRLARATISCMIISVAWFVLSPQNLDPDSWDRIIQILLTNYKAN